MQKINKKELMCRLFFPAAVLYTELLSHITFFGIEADGLLKIMLFSLVLGAGADMLLSLNKKYFAPSGIVLLSLLGFIHSVQFVYYGFFKSFFSWSAVGMAADLMQFWRETALAILKSTPLIICAFVPLIVFVIVKDKLFLPVEKKKLQLGFMSAVLAMFLICSFAVKENREALLYITGDTQKAFKEYGIVFGGTADAVSSVFPSATETVANPYEGMEVTDTEQVKVEYNVLNIDFDTLIANETNDEIRAMHEYFASVPPTEKNEYTGLFEGKNIIFLCLEGFSHKAIDKDLTPILHEMYTQGFMFENFYSSLWGGSTATGEYAVMTGNFFSKANCIKNSAKTNQYYSLGNIFKREGYNTYAYHNHTYTYYGRHKSHPNFGYDVFKAVGNGLKLTKGLWPNSDEELAIATVDEYINSEKPFHVYYMTVSGHAFYNWGGNHMSKRNRDIIPLDWTYSEGVKAYFACQYEVEKMLGVLLSKLEEAGKLEDTVFAMSCDHFPYALSDSELSDLYCLDKNGIRSNPELYKNAFIFWTPSM
ncbi:MAG: sulfatase-like hydrolase/transferase, partial [Clostridia bacterium]|nr:sulfatase-like hydrolase/transferase [Clostridia bacterium]